jgi:peptide/nickel transport system substrate-binding protein
MDEIRWLEGQLRRGRLSRRDFMGRASALGLSLAAAGVLADRSRAAEPQKGGMLMVGLGGGSAVDSLDPRSYTDAVAAIAGFSAFNLLTEIDAEGKVQPELAESWEAEPDARTWLIRLRQGVTFTNGKTLDAEDVVYSLDLHRGDDTTSGAKGIMTGIAAIEAVGTDQVKITLAEPNADLPYLLSDFHLLIMPAGFEDWSRPIGTGAFQITSFEPGVGVMAERNPNYWKAGRGHLDGYEIIVINDITARINALVSGQVQLINRVDWKLVDRLEGAPGCEIVRASGGQHYTFVMACDRAPFDDPNLRLAMKHAVDRELILKNILNGFGQVGNDHPIPAHDPFFNSELPQRPYDPDQAKFHLQQAGLEQFEVTLQASDAAFAGAVDSAVLFAEAAGKAGIAINVQREPADGYWSEVWMQVPFAMSYWNGRPTPDLMFSTAYQSDAAWNDSFWKKPEFDRLLLAARGMLDFDKRKELYWEMQRLVWEDNGNIIPMFGDFVDARREEVQGFEPNPANSLSGLRVLEKAWLAS